MLWITREKKDAKHVKNNACKKILMDREVSRYYRVEANLNQSTSYRESIEGIESCSIDRPSYRELSRLR